MTLISIATDHLIDSPLAKLNLLLAICESGDGQQHISDYFALLSISESIN